MEDSIKHLSQKNDHEEALPVPEIKTQKYLNLSSLVAEMLAHGCGIEGTAAKFGLAKDTIYRWLETLHFQALVALKIEEYRLELIGGIKKAGLKHANQWTALAWLAERSKQFSGDYHQPSKGNTSASITVNIGIAHPGKSADKRDPTLKITDNGDE
jgi:hypothetical protein